MKLVVMGTGPFAVPSFEALLRSEYEVCCLVTRPDKIARGRKQAPANPMREVAERAKLSIHAPEAINSQAGLDLLASVAADLLVVCDYGQILSKDALSKARLGGINLHGSLLPKYRGAAPINWALLEGERVLGVTVIHMTPRLDGGPMLTQRSLEIGDEEDAVEAEARLSELGVEPVLESIALLRDWDGEASLGVPQDSACVTKAPRLKKSDGNVDWSASATQISNRVRALKPWPGTFTNLLRAGRPPLRVILKRVHPAGVAGSDSVAVGSGGADDGGIHIQCGDGVLTIDRIQPAGKREMTADEFVRGYGAQLQFGDAEE